MSSAKLGIIIKALMLGPESEVRYSLAQINFEFDTNPVRTVPCSFIGGAQEQVAVFEKVLPSGFSSFFISRVSPNGVIESNWYSFDSENDDFYFSVQPFSKINHTYLCENIAFEKDSGRKSKAFCVIIFDPDSDNPRDMYYLNSELNPTGLITSDSIALHNGGIVSIQEFSQQRQDICDLQEIFGLEMSPEEFNFHAVRMDQSLTAVISVTLDDFPLDRREFIRVKVGEPPIALSNFYTIDRELDPKLIGPDGEVFWGTLRSKQFSPTLWSKTGIVQELEVPAEFSDLKLTPVGISKSSVNFGADQLLAFFSDREYCHPVTWCVSPQTLGEVPKLKPRSIVLNDMGAFLEIHDVCQYSGLIIATILPFGSSTPKKCILTPEIKI